MPYKDKKQKQEWHKNRLATDQAYAEMCRRSSRQNSAAKTAKRLVDQPNAGRVGRPKKPKPPTRPMTRWDPFAKRKPKSKYPEGWGYRPFERLAMKVNARITNKEAEPWKRKVQTLARGLRFMRTIKRGGRQQRHRRPLSDWTAVAKYLASRINSEWRKEKQAEEASLEWRWKRKLEALAKYIRTRSRVGAE